MQLMQEMLAQQQAAYEARFAAYDSRFTRLDAIHGAAAAETQTPPLPPLGFNFVSYLPTFQSFILPSHAYSSIHRLDRTMCWSVDLDMGKETQ